MDLGESNQADKGDCRALAEVCALLSFSSSLYCGQDTMRVHTSAIKTTFKRRKKLPDVCMFSV